jgi:hypothetical protein
VRRRGNIATASDAGQRFNPTVLKYRRLKPVKRIENGDSDANLKVRTTRTDPTQPSPSQLARLRFRPRLSRPLPHTAFIMFEIGDAGDYCLRQRQRAEDLGFGFVGETHQARQGSGDSSQPRHQYVRGFYS